MHFRYIPYLWPLALSGLFSAALSAYAWRHRTVPGARPFAAMMLLASIWTVANALEMAGTDLPTKLFWANVQYLGYSTVPVACFALAAEYTGNGHWLARGRLALLGLVPLFTQAMVWTDPWHGLMRHSFYLDTSGPFPVVGKTYGPCMAIHHGYSYLLVFASLALLTHALWRAPRHHRPQILALLAGLTLPYLSSLSYVLHINPIRWMDLTPAMFSVMGMVVTWGVFRWGLFDLVPVARSVVIEGLSDGMIVLDEQGRAVDVNPAAERLLGRPAGETMGRPASELLRLWPALLALCAQDGPGSLQLVSGGRSYDVRLLPLCDGRGRPLGRLIVLHDATELKQAEAQLLAQQRALAALQERERLARELHDGLGQVLGYLNIQAQAVREQVANGQTRLAIEALGRLAAVAQEAHGDVRAYIRDARPVTVGADGFVAALEALLRRFGDYYGLATELLNAEGLGKGALEPAVEAQLLRIAQEALSNVRKHAAARLVRVTLSTEGPIMQMAIDDDGCGFDPRTVPPEGSFGLEIMRERAQEAKGSLEVISAPGGGTRIVVRVPRHQEE